MIERQIDIPSQGGRITTFRTGFNKDAAEREGKRLFSLYRRRLTP